MTSKSGKCIVVSAPSGAGKTTIVHSLLEEIEALSFSISACSRPPRKKEENGKDYHFISLEEFKEKIKNNEFIEWEEVYKDSYYGTLKKEVEGLWSKGKAVVFDVDVIGGINLKQQMKEQCLSIFISPLHIDVLEERLRKRQTESEEKLVQRISKANEEMKYANKFDVVLVNDELETAKREAKDIVLKYLST